ncbi:MAG: type II toxin-antitoxin system HipA family toxin [Eubacterium sp.]
MDIYVYECFSSNESKFMGTLFVDSSKKDEHYSFEYSEKWLSETTFSYPIDPDISMYGGRQYPTNVNFGAFADSCPDRWGRALINRRERIQANKENRKPRKLNESDYLLGVYDETRMGALRFKTDKQGPFLSNDSNVAAPPWATLRTLEEASRRFEEDDNFLNDKWLKQLLKPGSSLGGARPKANIQAPDGSLWIAKFPSKNDEWNTGAWEKTVHDLAKMCGLNVPESKLETYSKLGSTFLVKRFDREGIRRIHFSSAMTMLNKTDGANADDGSGYLDMVAFLKAYGSSPKEDLLELWKRIVFNMAVTNTDDHFRNHGFILTKTGWRLSPLYDVNPVPYGDELSLNVNGFDNSISLELAVDSAPYFNLSVDKAKKIGNEIVKTVNSNWEAVAKKYGISRSSMEYMRPAFGLKTL